MKTNIYLILILLFTAGACEGPIGPRGPQGPPGNDGLNGEEAYTFDYTGINFTSSNDYQVLLELPGDFEMLDSDVALVYLFWGEDESGRAIWRPLPQNLMLEEGLLQYNFDFTTIDVSVFLDANFELNTLGANWTDNWVARVIVIPSLPENIRSALDVNDYYAVAEHFGLQATPVDEKYLSIKRPQ